MADKHIDDVLAIIDGGLQSQLTRGPYTVKVDQCVRDGCYNQPDSGHAFCPACLAWVNCETDTDPLPEKAPPTVTAHVPAGYEFADGADWVEYLSGYGYGYD